MRVEMGMWWERGLMDTMNEICEEVEMRKKRKSERQNE